MQDIKAETVVAQMLRGNDLCNILLSANMFL